MEAGENDRMFDIWLKENSQLSDSSVYKYDHAVNTISREMMKRKVIVKPLKDMELYEIDLAISLIFCDEYFIMKNEIGNKMYSNALKWFRSYVESNVFDIIEAKNEEEKIRKTISIPLTEQDAIVKARIGQGKFREQLLDKYGSCIISGVDISKVLVASHIKPWAVSTNEERISVSNGLLLSATYDRLFDSGFITFSKLGKLIVSRFVSQGNRQKLRICNGQIYDLKSNEKMKGFLEYHNDVVFIK